MCHPAGGVYCFYPMDQYFREAIEGLRDAARHLTAANQHLIATSQELLATNQEMNAAGAALVRATENALHARHEHEDVRETVHRLENTVLDLVAEVRKLRDRNGHAR
jgi:uncharacterized protein (DUF3084 family)